MSWWTSQRITLTFLKQSKDSPNQWRIYNRIGQNNFLFIVLRLHLDTKMDTTTIDNERSTTDYKSNTTGDQYIWHMVMWVASVTCFTSLIASNWPVNRRTPAAWESSIWNLISPDMNIFWGQSSQSIQTSWPLNKKRRYHEILQKNMHYHKNFSQIPLIITKKN